MMLSEMEVAMRLRAAVEVAMVEMRKLKQVEKLPEPPKAVPALVSVPLQKAPA